MNKIFRYSLFVAFGLLVLAVLSWRFHCRTLYKIYQSSSTMTHHVAGDSINTNSIASYSDQEIAIYGKWEKQTTPLAFMTFSLDDADDGFYWGKEWNENDKVFEKDLEEHRNGWFKWKIKNNHILLVYMSNLGFVIPIEYTITQQGDTLFRLQGKLDRTPQSYTRRYN